MARKLYQNIYTLKGLSETLLHNKHVGSAAHARRKNHRDKRVDNYNLIMFGSCTMQHHQTNQILKIIILEKSLKRF